jgi:hypothetical protein
MTFQRIAIAIIAVLAAFGVALTSGTAVKNDFCFSVSVACQDELRAAVASKHIFWMFIFDLVQNICAE